MDASILASLIHLVLDHQEEGIRIEDDLDEGFQDLHPVVVEVNPWQQLVDHDEGANGYEL